MKATNYHFNIGSFKCVAVSDGTMTYAPPAFPPPPNFLFVNANTDKLNRILSGHGIKIAEWKEWISSYACLLVDTGKYIVLIDTGAGSLAPSTGRLIENLKQEGVAPGDIHLVILSHAHPDHVGGNLNLEGKPMFARATYMICKNEWAFWISDQAERQLGEHGRDTLINIARKNLLPLERKIDLVDREVEIVPGICPIFVPGHTPGLIAISVSSEEQHLLCLSDAIIHTIHIAQPDWFGATDIIPQQVIINRLKLLEKAALERSMVMAFHFPFPGLGYINRKGEGWEWQPVIKT
ncbi:MAG: MBL fold metallo-hydrolase [Dehalococcoidales bacterium]|nr:MBL fold metallo-hydrolase [Dehalococcoidales bacterium]